MNSQMKIEELSFFEELQINLNLFELMKSWQDFPLGRFFPLGDFLPSGKILRTGKSCHVSFVTFSIDVNDNNHFSLEIF